MTKAEIIKDLVGGEFHFTDYGICGLAENGDILHWGEVCKVDTGDSDNCWVKANLYKLPKKWALAVQHSHLFYEWIDPDDTKTMNAMTKAWVEEELGIMEKYDKGGE